MAEVYGRYTDISIENPGRGRVPTLNMAFAADVVWKVRTAVINGDSAELTLVTSGERKQRDK